MERKLLTHHNLRSSLRSCSYTALKQSTCLPWLFLNSCIIAAALLKDHFIEFFPDTNLRFSTILRNNCSFEVGQYLGTHGSDCPSYWEWPNCLSSHLTTCILSNTEEIYKADLAAAGVLLGLLPSILALVASSFVESGPLSMRRPVLGFLLALGSPVVSPIRIFDFQDP